MSAGQLLPEPLAQRAASTPGRTALIWGGAGGACLSFAELDRLVSCAAERLAGYGIAADARVAILLRSGLEFVVLSHAVPRCGAVLVPLNARLAPAELRWQIEDSGASLLVHDAEHASAAAEALPGGGAVRLVAAAELIDRLGAVPAAGPRGTAPLIDLDATHTIMYTSGTTGLPKGAMLTWANHWWGAVGSALNLGLHLDDRWLAVLPLFHVGGLSILLRSVIYGIPAVVHESFDPARVNRAIDDDGVTIVSAVSVMLQRILEERGARPFPPALRCVLLGGGPAPRPLLEECARRSVPVVQTYGLTETASQIATLSPDDALRKLGSAGRPLQHSELRIVRDGAALPAGEVGEIVVRGPTVMAGYINRPDATAEALREGWLYTGDAGLVDAEGYLYVLDRRDDLIISGGENVYPAEIEAVLLAHPDVAEAGVVALQSDRWGQVPAAAVTLRPGAAPDEAGLVAFCAERLARYKLPRRIWFVPLLPRTASGKLQRAVLREQLARAPGPD